MRSATRALYHRWKRALARAGVRLVCAALLCVLVAADLPSILSAQGAPPSGGAPGYFRVEERDGIWWVIDPSGSPTLSIGVDNIAYEGDRIRGTGPSPYLAAAETRYASRNAWVRTAVQRLREWGFNTLGAWSDQELWSEGMPYTIILDFAARAGADWLRGQPPDVYDPRFAQTAREIAEAEAAPRADDRLLIGYFSDNELWWGPDWRRTGTMLATYLALPAGAPGRQRAIEFLRQRYGGDIRALNRAWRTAAKDFAHVPLWSDAPAYQIDADRFLEMVATRYFTVSAGAIRAADPHHLYLGARFGGIPPDPVLRAARVADIVSINLYSRDPRAAVRHVYARTHRPVLVTEFSFRALDSGLPNTHGAGPWVFNQRTRAWAYAAYVARLESLPEAVGYHWFRWADEPKEGRSDGENSNYGLVRLDDTPYAAFVATVRAVNQSAIEVHRGVRSQLAVRAASWWHWWSFRDIIGALLGAPRWVTTAVRTVRALLKQSPRVASFWGPLSSCMTSAV